MSELPPMSPRDERLYDLAIARATVGLTPDEEREFASLSAGVPQAELDAIENAVEAMSRALDVDDLPTECEPLPEHLQALLVAEASRIVGGAEARPTSDAGPIAFRGQSATTPDAAVEPAVIASLRRRARAGWMVAAASFIITAATFLSRGGGAPVPSTPSVREQVDRASDIVRVPLGATPDGTAGATGVVVWSEQLQKGYVTLTGLPANDARDKQYQFWIVDPKRDKNPIDGGVFDVAGTADPDGVVIAFEPRLPVARPAAFAITAERPGGVVVSAGPILMVGEVKLP
jgi:hypothetical protein